MFWSYICSRLYKVWHRYINTNFKSSLSDRIFLYDNITATKILQATAEPFPEPSRDQRSRDDYPDRTVIHQFRLDLGISIREEVEKSKQVKQKLKLHKKNVTEIHKVVYVVLVDSRNLGTGNGRMTNHVIQKWFSRAGSPWNQLCSLHLDS